jgi:hypothetical protein
MFFTPLESNRSNKFKRADLIVSLFCLLILGACSTKGEIVAAVNETEIYRTDAEMLMIHLGYDINSKSDWNTFLEQWTDNQMLKQELEQTYPDKAKLVQLKTTEYSGELSKFYLEEQLILKQLDSVVTEKEINNYYLKHQNSFALQDYLVKALYIKTPKGIKIEDKLRSAYLLKNDKDLNQVNSYAKLYAENFYFDDEQWIYFTELTKDIPLNKYNKDNIVLNRTKTYFSDEEFTYYLNIIDYKLKDETPPIEFLKPQIREIILSARVNNLREKLQSSLYKNIRKKHDIKIYYN